MRSLSRASWGLALMVVASCARNTAIVPESEAAGAIDATVTPAGREAGVVPGIEVFLSDVPAALRGKRVGLITKYSVLEHA